MPGYLIKDTTREEREKIVEESLGNISANCDGCMAGLAEMYQDYIEGKKEIRENLLSEKWPYSYYFCDDLKEFEVYKTKIKECIRNGN